MCAIYNIRERLVNIAVKKSEFNYYIMGLPRMIKEEEEKRGKLVEGSLFPQCNKNTSLNNNRLCD